MTTQFRCPFCQLPIIDFQRFEQIVESEQKLPVTESLGRESDLHKLELEESIDRVTLVHVDPCNHIFPHESFSSYYNIYWKLQSELREWQNPDSDAELNIIEINIEEYCEQLDNARNRVRDELIRSADDLNAL